MTPKTIRSNIARHSRLLTAVSLALASLLLPAAPAWAQG